MIVIYTGVRNICSVGENQKWRIDQKPVSPKNWRVEQATGFRAVQFGTSAKSCVPSGQHSCTTSPAQAEQVNRDGAAYH